jgi:hypothetical protein
MCFLPSFSLYFVVKVDEIHSNILLLLESHVSLRKHRFMGPVKVDVDKALTGAEEGGKLSRVLMYGNF